MSSFAVTVTVPYASRREPLRAQRHPAFSGVAAASGAAPHGAEVVTVHPIWRVVRPDIQACPPNSIAAERATWNPPARLAAQGRYEAAISAFHDLPA